MQITYFVHSTTEDNERRIASGWVDVELSPTGMQQAHELKKHVAAHSFDAVYCSDFRRARQTAEIAFGEDVRFDSRLREMSYGTYNGGPANIVSEKALQSIIEPFPAGEACIHVEERMRRLLRELVKEHENGHIAFVSHRFPQLALDVIVNQKTWEEAFANDWRNTGAWQPGWHYDVSPVLSDLIDGGTRHE